MKGKRSIGALLVFVGSALCFFFPFVTVSCAGQQAFTLSGEQLAVGTTIGQTSSFRPSESQKVDADPFAAIAALCALAGIGLTFLGRRMATGAAIAGGAGAVSLIALRVHLNSQIQNQGHGMITTDWGIGFIAALLCLCAGAAWNGYLILQDRSAISGAWSSLPGSSPPLENSSTTATVVSPAGTSEKNG